MRWRSPAPRGGPCERVGSPVRRTVGASRSSMRREVGPGGGKRTLADAGSVTARRALAARSRAGQAGRPASGHRPAGWIRFLVASCRHSLSRVRRPGSGSAGLNCPAWQAPRPLEARRICRLWGTGCEDARRRQTKLRAWRPAGLRPEAQEPQGNRTIVRDSPLAAARGWEARLACWVRSGCGIAAAEARRRRATPASSAGCEPRGQDSSATRRRCANSERATWRSIRRNAIAAASYACWAKIGGSRSEAR